MSEKLLATRDAFGKALLHQGEANPELVVVSCDLCGATRTKKFGETFPERFFEVGIAEQNGIGIAAGLALGGLRPFITSFGAFISGRYDQIRISCAYNEAGVVIVGTHAGLAIGKDGATQMGLEDINIISGIPGIQIFQPADTIETQKIVEYLAQGDQLAYLRLSRRPQPDVFDQDYQFQFNQPCRIREGQDVCLIASGDMVYHSMKAADKLSGDGMEASVINVSTLKPMNTDAILKCVDETKAIVVVEDHSIVGGLGSRICEIVSEAGDSKRVLRHGVNDCFGESGSPEDLYRKHKLDADGIYETVKSFIQSF